MGGWGGWVREGKVWGVDVMDGAAGGLRGDRFDLTPGYMVPFAARIRAEAGISTQAVGLVLTAMQAEAIIARGEADLVALGREALVEPH